MTVKLANQPLEVIYADLTLQFLTADQLETHSHKSLLIQAGFKAEQEQLCPLHEHRLLICGISDTGNESIRSAMGTAIKAAMNYGYGSIKLSQYGEDLFKCPC